MLDFFIVSWTCTGPLAALLVLQREPAWSRSTSESSRLRLSSELESCTTRLSVVVLLLGDGELRGGVASRTGGGFGAFPPRETSAVCMTTESSENMCNSGVLVRGTGVGISMLGRLETETAVAEGSSESRVLGEGVGGGGGAFLFLWPSELGPS